MFRVGKDAKEIQGMIEPKIDLPKENMAKMEAVAPAPQNGTNGNSLYQYPAETSTTSRPVSESEALARDIKEGVLSGFVGNGTKLTGEADFKGMLRIDGNFAGNITSADGTLLVGTNGQVDADIAVAVATIHGTVNGDITATKRIEIGRTSRVVGNIQTPSLIIEQGGIFEGSCRMMQLKETADKQRAEEVRAASSVPNKPVVSAPSKAPISTPPIAPPAPPVSDRHEAATDAGVAG